METNVAMAERSTMSSSPAKKSLTNKILSAKRVQSFETIISKPNEKFVKEDNYSNFKENFIGTLKENPDDERRRKYTNQKYFDQASSSRF